MTRSEILKGLKEVVEELHCNGKGFLADKVAFRTWKGKSDAITLAVESLSEIDEKWVGNQYQGWFNGKYKDQVEECQAMMQELIDRGLVAENDGK